MAQLSRIALFSDVHIGTNAPTNWYQRAVHEPYLLAAFDYIRNNASVIDELVLVGDFVDQWTYEPSRRPPTFQEIAAANPNVFGGTVGGEGVPGALGQALSALKGRVTYLSGNHDMAVTAGDLVSIRDDAGHALKHFGGPVYTPSLGNGQIACTHGHLYSLLNAPDYANSPGTGLPLAHFITRLAALWTQQQLARYPDSYTAADLPGSGDPVGWPLAKDVLRRLIEAILRDHQTLADVVIGSLLDLTGQTRDLPFTLADGTRITAGEVMRKYRALFAQYAAAARREPQLFGTILPEVLALGEVDARNTLVHFADVLGARHKVVVMGHTHVPEDAEEHAILRPTTVYANCGFNCPSVPDMAKTDNRPHPTFTEILRDDAAKRFIVATRYVVRDGSTFRVAPDPLTPPKSIPMG